MVGVATIVPGRKTFSYIIVSIISVCVAGGTAWGQGVDDVLEFQEVWAYLMRGEESYLSVDLPISDLCYFSAEINAYGELVGVPDIKGIASYKGRKHLVVAEIGSYSLTHFCLDPTFPIRDALIASILKASLPFDGVQIDFEAIPIRDRDNFVEFLRMLKKALGKKILSVALPAKVSESGDVLGYARISAVVDRIIVMAYDENWSTSGPGPVASMDWCKRIAAFSITKIDAAKLVMGLPFYGRAWADKKPARAYKYSSVESLVEEKSIGVFFRDKEVPWFRYEETVSVVVYYDDADSTAYRLGLYRDAGIGAVAFWRLGQEDRRVWKSIRSR